jgi:hypothetical protein
MFSIPAGARAAFLSLFLLLGLVTAAPGCGGDTVRESEPSGVVSMELRSEKKDGKEVGLPWLEPAIARPDAQAMINGFAWSSTVPLRELDADGAPALYYAVVYLTSRAQAVLLDEVHIHHSFMPLFDHETAKWQGKKGKMSQSTDGRGAFVFTVIPGKIYNLIRTWALAGDPLFPAVIVREIPKQARNDEGSLSYDYLVHARLKYAGMEPIRLPPGVGTSSQKLVIVTARLALKTIAEAAVEVVRLIAIALGNRDRNGLIFGWGAAGTVTLRLKLDVRDTDPSFGGTSMRRAWGIDAGQPVMLPGVRVSIWSRGDSTVLGLPTLFEATTGADSVAVLKLAKDRAVRQLCIATENDAAELTDLLTEVEVCTFEGAVDKGIDNLKLDTFATVAISDPYFNILAQATEGRAYLKDVAGYSPHKATIVVGWIADAMGAAGTGAAFAPCLGFPNISADLLVVDILGLIATIPVAGPPLAATLAAATPLMAADIFFPESDSLLSRGAPTHEYGHFAMCSMLFDANPTYISTSWTNAVAERIGSGAEPPATKSAAYDIEAFADFFAGQVVGGTNYFAAGTLFSGIMSYCDVNDPVHPGHDACLDQNFSSEATFKQQIARVATTLHDAFDGDRYNSTFVNQPGNGNVWTGPALGPFVFDGSSRNGDSHDEAVLLPGAALRTFVGKLSDLTATTFMTSLAQTMRESGYDWCQTCRVFSLHTGLLPTATPEAHYAACAQAPLASWVGAAPDTTSPTSCNFTQCPAGQVQIDQGCGPCAANEIAVNGTACLTCPPGTQVIDNQCQTCTNGGTCVPACAERQQMVNGVCQDCAWPDVSVNGTCQPCPAGEYRYHNTCVTTCPPELSITTIVDGVCTYGIL